MTVKLVNDGTAILSMRESDFDAYSAFGEVVDNSIQADAKKVKIKLFDTTKDRYEYIERIAFGDDGYGMPIDVLHRCLQLGYSSRYNDRSGIGRFGVGMTLAAINQCQRVDVYSKTKENNKWMYTFIDLQEIVKAGENTWPIPDPVDKDLPSDCKELVGKDGGTLVIWTKYDRQPETVSDMLPKMHEWFGRTYRYFLWDGLVIELNAVEVKVIDPLFITWDKTRFPGDPPGTSFDPIHIEWPIPIPDKDVTKDASSVITVKMSLVHESLRPYAGIGGAKQQRERFIDKNEGISVLRNKREVFYGHIPYWPGGSDWWKDIDRWWGCEIHFDAVLDRAFTVKNIKRGAVPQSELKRTIYDKILPTRNTCIEKVQEVYSEYKKKEKLAKEEKSKVITGHEAAEEIAKKTPTDKGEIDKGKDFDEEARNLVDEIKKGAEEIKKAEWIAKWKSQPFTIHEEGWTGPLFMEAVHLGGRDVIKYNTDHLFFQLVNKIIEELEASSNDYAHAIKMKNLIDLLLISYSKAEAKFDKDDTFTAEQFVENMKLNWGMYLRSYLTTWSKEEELL